MSGHLCVGCHSEEATIRERRGHRLRFCNAPCQSAFYAGITPLKVGFGLMDEVRDVPSETLFEKLEATFRPYAGPDLPVTLATSLFYMGPIVPDTPGQPLENEFPTLRIHEVYGELFAFSPGEKGNSDGLFLGWDYRVLARAVFDRALEYGYDRVVAMMLLVPKDTLWLWGEMHRNEPYDVARVAYVFDRIETMDWNVRLSIARTIVEPMHELFHMVHFSRRAIRLCIGADDRESYEKALKGPHGNLVAYREAIVLAAQAGSRVLFLAISNGLARSVQQGEVGADLPTVKLARTLADKNNWIK